MWKISLCYLDKKKLSSTLIILCNLFLEKTLFNCHINKNKINCYSCIINISYDILVYYLYIILYIIIIGESVIEIKYN